LTLNLSCGQCNAIRGFSGTPPACDVCGWVYNSSSQQTKAATVRTKKDFSFGTLINLIILALIAYVILPASWTDPFLYSTEYSINSDRVHRNNRPTDCDFMHAPLGGKGCHYKKTVTAYNAVGNPVGGDGGVRYSKNTIGNPIVSYDDGKTWQVLPADSPVPDLTVKTVEIDWIKVTD
jgi:hypothetical protein